MKDFFVVWVFPPLVGAVIGLFTNWLAIKMLFRPLREVRFLGIRIPFTPGILPRERYRISVSLGDTVAKELLTEEVLRRRLNDPSIREGLCVSVSGLLGRGLDLPAADVVRPSEHAGEVETIIGSSLGHAFRTLAGSEAFSIALAAALRKFLETVGALPLSSFVGAESIDSFMDFLLGSQAEASGQKFLDGILTLVYGKPEGKKERILPPEVLDPVVRVLAEGLFKACIPVIESFMDEPATRRQLEAQAFVIVRRAVGRLNPLQRIVATAANYERTVSEAMPATIDDLSKAVSGILRREEMPAIIAGKASSSLRGEGEKGSSFDFASIVPKDAALKALASAMSALREHRAEVAARLTGAYMERRELSVAGLVGDLGLPVDRIVQDVATTIASALASPEKGKDVLTPMLSTFRTELARQLGAATVAEALGIDPERRARLSSGIADKVLELISQEAGNIIAGLDIRKIVVERIDELDVKEVERMILDVVSNELVWITVIGGVLGGLIGIVQSIIYALGR